MHKRALSLITRCARLPYQCNVLPQKLLPVYEPQRSHLSFISNEATTGTNDIRSRVPLLEKELFQPNNVTQNSTNTFSLKMMASEKIKEQLSDMFNDIHKELDAGILSDSELTKLVKYVHYNL